MEYNNYEQPTVEIVEVSIEKGFAGTAGYLPPDEEG